MRKKYLKKWDLNIDGTIKESHAIKYTEKKVMKSLFAGIK